MSDTPAFNIDLRPTFTRTVKVLEPAGTGTVEKCFKATFNVLDVDETEPYNFNTSGGTRDFLCKVIVSLDGLEGKDGPVDYSELVRDRVLAKRYARLPLLQAYWNGLNGEAEGN